MNLSCDKSHTALHTTYGLLDIECYTLSIMSKTLTAIITEEDGGFVALNPDTDVASQGDTLDEALANLREALELYFEETAADVAPDSVQHATFLTTVTI